jgi:deoxyribonucleoside regulator
MDDERKRLLFKVAQMHHRQGLNKTQIANELRVSTTQVVRLLKDAANAGFVRVDLVPPRMADLEGKLQERFDALREVRIVATGNDPRFQLEMLGSAAAEYFDETVVGGLKVAVSGGQTVYEMIDKLPRSKRDIEVYPVMLVGMGPHLNAHFDPMVSLSHLSEKSGIEPRRAHYATVPPFDPGRNPAQISRDNAELLDKHLMVKQVWDGMHAVDVVFGTIAPLYDEEYQQYRGKRALEDRLESAGITREELRALRVVGDISYALFDDRGEGIEQLEGLFLRLGTGAYREMASAYPQKRVVVLAGSYKTKVLRAALMGRLLNVLVTDDYTAEQLLRES